MITIQVLGDRAIASGELGISFVRMMGELDGKKSWLASKKVEFDASRRNIERLRASEFKIRWDDKSGIIAELEEFATMPTQTELKQVKKFRSDYKPQKELFEHQKEALRLSAKRNSYALLLEMGLGKTAIVIANAGYLHQTGRITGLLILSPKGVHRQWIEDQFPEHIDKRTSWTGWVWKGKEPPPGFYAGALTRNPGQLQVLSMNIDAVRTKKGFHTAEQFLEVHIGHSMMVIDESHLIKSWSAQRTKSCMKLGEMAEYRRILTGTPIAKNIMDAWTQFNFLDPRILDCRYAVNFRSRYCIMGGFEGKQIVGQRNTEEFYGLIAPHSYRKTVDEVLDLPQDIPKIVEYEMGTKTRKHYEELRDMFLTFMDSGEIVDAANGAVAILRLQQVVCGYLPVIGEADDADAELEIISDERLDVMMNIVEQFSGAMVIWARFVPDIQRITARLREHAGDDQVVTYYGGDSDRQRIENKERYISGEARYFVANPAVGGTGTDGLQKVTRGVINYSNSFNALERWQSNFRTRRLGMKQAVFRFDIVAQKSVDKRILANLSAKKSVSDMTFDQIRAAISGD